MTSNSRSLVCRRILTLGAALCIGILLLTTFAQALDSCEFAQLRTTHHFCAEYSSQSAPSTCLICASAHTPSLAAPVSSILTPVRITGVSGMTGESFHLALQIFALYVRPPPLQ